MGIYANFKELNNAEEEGRSFRVFIRELQECNTAIIAPHGGGIEPGTSEISAAIADKDLSLALFEGTKNKRNGELHITSTNFDEPRCLALIQSAQNVVAIHGEASQENVVYLGGADIELGVFIRSALESYEFQVSEHNNSMLHGKAGNNICNRGYSGKGVQLELARGLRETLFDSLTAEGRKKPTEKLNVFVNAVREGLRNAGKL